MKKIVLWVLSLLSLFVLCVGTVGLSTASKEDRLATAVFCILFLFVFIGVTLALKIKNKRTYIIHLALLILFFAATAEKNDVISVIIVIISIAIILYLIFGYRKNGYNNFRHNTSYINLTEVDNMDGVQFENYSADLLKAIGYYNVRVTRTSNDFGVDVLAEKDGIKYAVQCKRYSHKVDNSAVQEVVAGKQYYNCDRAIVITNNYFTKNAIQLANINNVELWNRNYLVELITQCGNNKKQEIDKANKKSVKSSSNTNNPYLFTYNYREYKKATEENEIRRNKTYDNYKWFDYNELIDNQIAFGALINSVPEEVKNELFSSGALIPTKEPLYPEFSFSEEEWEQCGKDYETLCAFLKKKNVWYNKSLQDLDRYTESDFIKYVKDLLVGLQYENIVDTNSEMGVDITCSKDDINYAIKCQHSISQKVSVKPIRNIAAGKNYYQCQVGIVISNNYYSTSAIDMANANAIILWDRDKLQSIMYGKV